MPRIWNRRNKNTPKDVVRVDRGTKWGNPFIMRNNSAAERNRVCDTYEQWIACRPELIDAAKRELKGKDLACWCAPKRCHAETLMRIANGAG